MEVILEVMEAILEANEVKILIFTNTFMMDIIEKLMTRQSQWNLQKVILEVIEAILEGIEAIEVKIQIFTNTFQN